MKEINVEEIFEKEKPVIIDIRSPIEFKDGAIPGAINIPLFSDEERTEIGTIYKQTGPEKAQWRAMEIVSPKLPTLLKDIKESTGDSKVHPIIHCWRGGMRSRAVVTFLDFSGIRSTLLTGGYKAYRQFILSEIPKILPERAVVLHGLTGVGKTEILKRLDKMGFPVLDLEEMACHRGSIFGNIGLGEGHNQKIFDSFLFKRLQELKGSSFFLMEAESKRVGKAMQPDELMNKKTNGINIYIHTPLEQRVKHIVKEYIVPYEHLPWYHTQISESLERVLKRVKDNEMKKILLGFLEKRQYTEMVPILLENYYDPKYDFKRQDYNGEFYDIFVESHEEAAEKIAQKLEQLSFKSQPI
ncbi:MAG: tRNA 2-selenouridine(34) synthase MnmH [Bacillota bacterium]|nr:tRNA 2-selenouridine(34) synthase MnmH [Bacillota bacterium]